jgi:DNA segregation ATPase FtsK/SpoIIIE-like protein
MLVMTRRMSQLMGFLILASMIFVLLSVGSYSLDDPAWNHYTSQEVIDVENLGGRVGAFLADWGLQLFGSTVFVFIACTALGAICLMRARMRPIVGAAWRGLLLIVAVSTLAHLYWIDDPFFKAGLLAGGASGQWLAEFLVPYLELPGTYAVAGWSVLCVLLSCARLSLLKGVRHVVAAVRLTKEHRESDDSFLFDEDLDLRAYPSAFQDDDDRGVSPDETISKKSDRMTVPRVRRLATETRVADPNLEQATPAESRPLKVPKPPSFLAQRVRKSQQSHQVFTRGTISEKSDREETPRVEQPAPENNMADLGRKPAASSEHRPSKIPILPSFRAKYVMELQRSIQKPARKGAPEKNDGKEAPLVESPVTEENIVDPSKDELAPSEARASQAAKRPSFRAKRATEPPRIVEALPRETVPEEIDREEVSLAERSMPEVSVAEPIEEQAASSEAPTPQVSILQPLPVKHVTPSQQPQLPSLDLLEAPLNTEEGQSEEELMERARFLEQKLREFGVEGEVVQVSPGPVITMYEFAPAAGVKVNKIANLQDDLALVMRALSVRIVAPVPGKAVVGIEVPNVRRETIALRSLLDTEEFQGSSSKLNIVLGKDILGQPVITDLALIPHLLVAGATGSGKSVGLNSVICSLLFRVTPAEVKLIMIDPKMLEFSIYDGIPHLLVPVVTDSKKAAVALRRVVAEMERRYQLLAAKGVRSIAQYNQRIRDEQARSESNGADAQNQAPPAEPLPYLVVVVDELSDLMMVSSREVEDSLMRIAQMARAAGIHLIVATQRPSVDVLTGVIKANFPARLSFQVTSKIDSRTILDANGAETLLGRGDMLFLAPGASKPQRVHGAYVSEEEITRLVEAWKAIEQPKYNDSFLEPINEQTDDEDSEYDEKYDEAVALVARTGQASISMLQRRLRVGYNRAARMIEVMEKKGVVGPADGVKPREVLVRDTYDEV